MVLLVLESVGFVEMNASPRVRVGLIDTLADLDADADSCGDGGGDEGGGDLAPDNDGLGDKSLAGVVTGRDALGSSISSISSSIIASV